MHKEFLKDIKNVSKSVKQRTKTSVVLKMVEELGELSTEVAISENLSNKERGSDGVIGEAVDVILCAMDLIVMENPEITKDELNDVLYSKMNKWYFTCKEKVKTIEENQI